MSRGYVQLAHERSDGGSNLDTEILIDRKCTFWTIDIAQHGGGNRDSKNVISIGKETDTRYETCPNMVPAAKVVFMRYESV